MGVWKGYLPSLYVVWELGVYMLVYSLLLASPIIMNCERCIIWRFVSLTHNQTSSKTLFCWILLNRNQSDNYSRSL